MESTNGAKIIQMKPGTPVSVNRAQDRASSETDALKPKDVREVAKRPEVSVPEEKQEIKRREEAPKDAREFA